MGLLEDFKAAALQSFALEPYRTENRLRNNPSLHKVMAGIQAAWEKAPEDLKTHARQYLLENGYVPYPWMSESEVG